MGKRLNTDEFIRRANIVHGYKYDYSHTIYQGYDKKVEIICKKHGPFLQRPHDHIGSRCGCPRCAQLRSKAEMKLSEFIEGLGFYVINNNRNLMESEKKEIDVYVPSAHLGIEFNGLRYHSSYFRGYPNMHREKYEKCLESNIRLLQFYEDEWFKDRESIFKTVSDVLYGRDVENFDLFKEINVNLDIGIGIDLNKQGYELVKDTGPIPYRVFNNYKSKEPLVGETEDPIVWLSGIQTWRKT